MSPFTDFVHVSPDVRKFIHLKSSNASCNLDSQPTWLLKEYLDQHIHVLTTIVNSSLSSGTFPESAHHAVITPLLKKSTLDKDELKNYRPVSNLKFTAKLIERCAASQFVQHVSENDLMDTFQSAYRANHSTETALMKVQQDIMNAVDSKQITLVVLLDLSAAFDTIDHHILLNRLQSYFNVSGTALNWFASYLHGWSSQVNIHGNLSNSTTANFGVPQGSVLGPLLFTSYMAPIGHIIKKHGISYHTYADDTQLYVSYDPRIPGALESALQRLTNCINEIKDWMAQNYLKLNDSKTEFFIAGSHHNLRHLPPSIELSIGSSKISPSVNIRNLGVMFDSPMSLSPHVSKLRSVINFHIKNLWRIRRFINFDSCHHAVRALVTSRLDYCNALFTQLSVTDVQKLQRLQNRAARVTFAVGRRVEAGPLLEQLHWLPVQQRIIFKILVQVYKALHDESPVYISDLLTYYRPGRNLRSSNDTSRLFVPRTHTSAGDKCFNAFAPNIWNSLPEHLRLMDSTDTFKKHLKTHLFVSPMQCGSKYVV